MTIFNSTISGKRQLDQHHGDPGLENDRKTVFNRKRVVFIKERYFSMLKKDLTLRNPLRLMGHDNNDILPAGGFVLFFGSNWYARAPS